jgi:hypothetical protein
MRILKTIPKDVNIDSIPYKFEQQTINPNLITSKPKTETRRLTVGKIYLLETLRDGMELEFKAKFLGWEKYNPYSGDNGYYTYRAIFEPIDYVKVECIYDMWIEEI